MSEEETTQKMKKGLNEIVKDYPHLLAETERILSPSHEDAIKGLNLDHLKVKNNLNLINIDEE